MKTILKLALLILLPAITQAQVTVNWASHEQTMQGFGAGNNFIGTSMNPYDTLFFNTLGYSLLRTSVPLGPGGAGPYPCDSVQSSCATGADSITDMTACIANGCSVWGYVSNPPGEYNSSGSYACTVNPALSPASYGAFATYVSNFIASLKNFESIPLISMSVQNEPDNTSGCQMSAAQMDTFIKTNLGPTMSSASQTSTLIMMPEVGGFHNYTAWAGTCMSDSPCAAYVGINAFHDYDNTASVSNPYSKLFWETEVSDVGPPSPVAPGCAGNTWCPGIDDAIMWATIISDYINDGVQAWHYFWYVDNDTTYGTNANVALINPDQSPAIATRAYAIANWAKFVRPGWVRVGVTYSGPLLINAFEDSGATTGAIVVVNTSTSSVTGQNFSVGTQMGASVVPWITSGSQNLVSQPSVAVSAGSFTYTIPGSSVVTFQAGAAPGSSTYYVDYVNGSDSNNGTSKTTSLKHAPGMNGCASNCNFTPNPADQIILKGGIVWPNAAFSWSPAGTGTSGNNIYYGVDKTWWDTAGCQNVTGVAITSGGSGYTYDPIAVTFAGGGGSGATGIALHNSSGAITSVQIITGGSGYSSAPTPIFAGVGSSATGTATVASGTWCRPIFDLGDAAVTDSLQRVITPFNSYTTLDNFEIRNICDCDSNFSGENETHVFDVGNNILIENMYIHDWKQAFFSVGTGNLSSGSSTVTNFVPYSYSPSPSSSWIGTGAGQSQFITTGAFNGLIPATGNGATVTGISGTNPYSITWTSAGPATGNCTGCAIEIGGDYFRAFVGNEMGSPGTVVQNSIVDGSDTPVAQLNIYGDCGLSEGDNQFCGSSGIGEWHGPNIFRDDVIRYVASGAVGNCQELSGSLIEYGRFSSNFDTHTNIWECLDTTAGTSLMYGNVFRHMNQPNGNGPQPQSSLGLATQINPPNTSSTTYIFNNVGYDLIQNNLYGLGSGTTGCQSSCGTIYHFNNTTLGGPSWNTSYQAFGPTPCPSFLLACYSYNEHIITTNSTPCGTGAGTQCNTSTGSFTASNSIVMTPTTATSDGYTASQTFAYSPTTFSNPTVGVGQSISSICTAINSAQLAAGTACGLDTPYGVSYNQTSHTVVIPARTPVVRPSTPDVGAYQFTGGSSPAANPSCSPGAGTYSSTQSVTCSTSSGGAIICYTTNGTTPATNGTTGCATGTKYSSAISISSTSTLKAIAGGSGYSDSSVVSYFYTITVPTASTPSCFPGTGTYTSTQSVTCLASTGPTLCYTVNGSTPQTNGTTGCTTGTLYSGAISVASSETLKVVAGGTGFLDGPIATYTYTITTQAANPSCSPGTGSYTGSVNPSCSDSSSGASMVYTTDGSTPVISPQHGTTYSGALTFSATTTLKIIAGNGGYTPSSVVTYTYTISGPPTASTPTCIPGSGIYSSTQTVACSAATGPTLCYTTNGTTPATNGTTGCTTGTHYTTTISVAATEVLKVIAGGTGFTDGSVASFTYTITPPFASTPVCSPGSGTYPQPQSVTCSAASGPVICYTVDGATPQTNGTSGCTTGTLYSGAITVSSTETLKAIAGGTSYTDGSVASYSYTITQPNNETPWPLFGYIVPGNGNSCPVCKLLTGCICQAKNGFFISINGSAYKQM